ncbi:MAG: hypothetical protein AAF569_04310 [Pseudomonadota bacterium]
MRGQDLSLQDAMRAVAQRMEALRLMEPEKPKHSPMTELQAFIQMDDLLAELYKEFQDVKHNRQTVIAQNGQDDAMAQVAAELEDSAWCAMQTRLLELRSQRILMRKAQRLMYQAQRAEDEAEEQARVAKLASFAQHVGAVEKNRKQKGMPGLIEWLIFYLWVQREKQKLMQHFAEPSHLRIAA